MVGVPLPVGRTNTQQPVKPDLLEADGRSQPRTGQFSKTKMCKFEIMGMCAKGEDCQFAHRKEELNQLPDLRCTKLCKTLIQTGACEDKSCTYAHSFQELRATSTFHKTKLCRFSQLGHCALGAKCNFAHSTSEIRAVDDPLSGKAMQGLSLGGGGLSGLFGSEALTAEAFSMDAFAGDVFSGETYDDEQANDAQAYLRQAVEGYFSGLTAGQLQQNMTFGATLSNGAFRPMPPGAAVQRREAPAQHLAAGPVPGVGRAGAGAQVPPQPPLVPQAGEAGMQTRRRGGRRGIKDNRRASGFAPPQRATGNAVGSPEAKDAGISAMPGPPTVALAATTGASPVKDSPAYVTTMATGTFVAQHNFGVELMERAQGSLASFGGPLRAVRSCPGGWLDTLGDSNDCDAEDISGTGASGDFGASLSQAGQGFTELDQALTMPSQHSNSPLLLSKAAPGPPPSIRDVLTGAPSFQNAWKDADSTGGCPAGLGVWDSPFTGGLAINQQDDIWQVKNTFLNLTPQNKPIRSVKTAEGALCILAPNAE